MSANRRVFGLDVMRAAAILSVVFAHYFASTPLRGGGLLGVEIFFVLSGFLIGDILIRSMSGDGVTLGTLRLFWLKRWFRTLPNYAAFLLLNIALALLTTSHLQNGWWLYPVFLQNFFQPMPGFFRESWSLAVEEWFYLLFPLLVLALNRGVRLRPRVLLTVVALFLIVPFLLRWNASRFWDLETIRMIVPLRLDTMMYGVMAAIVMNWHPAIWSRLTEGFFLVAAFVLLGCGLYFVDHANRLSSIVGFPLIAGGIALVLPFLQSLPRRGAILAGAIEYISRVSYSTYLLHMPFFFLVESMISWGRTPLFLKLAVRLLMIVSVLLVSYLPYKFIEQPFLAMRERLLTKKKLASMEAAKLRMTDS